MLLCLQFLIHQGFTLTTIPRTVHPNDVTFTGVTNFYCVPGAQLHHNDLGEFSSGGYNRASCEKACLAAVGCVSFDVHSEGKCNLSSTRAGASDGGPMTMTTSSYYQYCTTTPFTTTTLMDAQWSWTLKYHDERPQYYSQAANAFLEWDELQTSWKITRDGLKWCLGWPVVTPSQLCQSYQDTNVGCDRSIAGDCFEKGTDACEAMDGCAGVAMANNNSWTTGHVRLCTAQGHIVNNSDWSTSWNPSGDECVLLAKWKDIDVYDPATSGTNVSARSWNGSAYQDETWSFSKYTEQQENLIALDMNDVPLLKVNISNTGIQARAGQTVQQGNKVVGFLQTKLENYWKVSINSMAIHQQAGVHVAQIGHRGLGNPGARNIFVWTFIINSQSIIEPAEATVSQVPDWSSHDSVGKLQSALNGPTTSIVFTTPVDSFFEANINLTIGATTIDSNDILSQSYLQVPNSVGTLQTALEGNGTTYFMVDAATGVSFNAHSGLVVGDRVANFTVNERTLSAMKGVSVKQEGYVAISINIVATVLTMSTGATISQTRLDGTAVSGVLDMALNGVPQTTVQLIRDIGTPSFETTSPLTIGGTTLEALALVSVTRTTVPSAVGHLREPLKGVGTRTILIDVDPGVNFHMKKTLVFLSNSVPSSDMKELRHDGTPIVLESSDIVAVEHLGTTTNLNILSPTNFTIDTDVDLQVGGVCLDINGWTNPGNFDCDSYQSKGWCENGKPRVEWTVGEKFNFPELNCW